ncbi:CRISPR type III-associated RAMP protein Csm5 [Synergistales bacterium]|nr:CRISPR type III-associated RAMP protein Csm5 [Synergistales bacterium]
MNGVIRLKTLSPVFIGGGAELNKKEYVRVGDHVAVTDMPKLYGYLRNKGLDKKYEGFLSSPRMDLKDFLSDAKITGKDYDIFTKYNIDSGDAFNNGGGTSKGISSFMRDGFGKPYIPGSSLKGALRTAVLSRLVLEDSASYRQAAGDDWISGKRNDRSGGLIEAKAFRSLKFNDRNSDDAVNDIFRALIVSDSPPLKDLAMTLCQKIDRDTEGDEHPINTLRECIKPGATIDIPLSIDTKMFAALGGGDPFRYIMECVKVFSGIQSDFARAFSRGPYADNTVILGGGAGYVSKTVTYPLYGGDAVGKVSRLMQKQFPKHKHDKDERAFGVSPHALKCTRYKGVLYDMGLCEVVIK